MSENQIAYILSSICLILIILSYKTNKKFTVINLILFLIYNAFFYNILFNSTGGVGLYGIVGLLLFLPIHILILIIFLIKNLVKKKFSKWLIAILLLLLIAFVVGFSIVFIG